MKHHQLESSVDRISDLPGGIVDTILKFLPMQDVVRTSILSRDWRDKWVTVPRLLFEENKNTNGFEATESIVFETLVQHQGQIRTFTLDLTSWKIRSKINKILPFLSRKGVRDLTVTIGEGRRPLLTSIYSCAELKHVWLAGFEFQALTLTRFDKLVTVTLLNILLPPQVFIPCGPLLEILNLLLDSEIHHLSIDAPNLIKFLYAGSIFASCVISAPLLKDLTLVGCIDPNTQPLELDIISILQTLPLLERLQLSCDFRMLLGRRESSIELSVVLKNLRLLQLDGLNLVLDEHPTTHWLMRSVPNLQTLQLELYQEMEDEQLEVKHVADYLLLNLREIEVSIECDWSKPKFNIEFVKFLLAISPVLETLYIKISVNYIGASGYKVLSELISFRGASSLVKIVIIAPD